MNKISDEEKDRILIETGFYLFELIRAAIHGIKAEEKPEEISWETIYQLAKSNGVENLCVYGIRTLEKIPPEALWSQWNRLPEYITFQMIRMDMEREKIVFEMEKYGISHLLLKGNRIAECYPKQGMRKMSDNDILFGIVEETETGFQVKGTSLEERENTIHIAAKIVREIMQKKGYVLYDKGNVHDIYVREPNFVFEMHKRLMSRQSALYDYYENSWEHAMRDSMNSYSFHLKADDELIYMLAHSYKHFSGGGTGIRILADIYVFLEKNKSYINWKYVKDELKKLQLENYGELLIHISKKMFDLKACELSLQEMNTVQFMFSAGTYGKIELKAEQGMKQYGKVVYLLRRIFPPKTFWYETFPISEKYPWMIIFFWLYRLLTGPWKRKRRIKKELQLLFRK